MFMNHVQKCKYQPYRMNVKWLDLSKILLGAKVHIWCNILISEKLIFGKPLVPELLDIPSFTVFIFQYAL